MAETSPTRRASRKIADYVSALVIVMLGAIAPASFLLGICVGLFWRGFTLVT